MPAYKDPALRGNTEVGLMSGAIFQNGTVPPAGVKLVSWAGVFRGAVRPGTYTEKDLLSTKLDTAGVRLESKKNISGLRRAKLVVKSVTNGDVHDDIVSKGGPLREDKIKGELELVIGDAPSQVTIQATLDPQ